MRGVHSLRTWMDGVGLPICIRLLRRMLMMRTEVHTMSYVRCASMPALGGRSVP